MGYFTLGLNFLIWSPSVTIRLGDGVYDDCDKWDDGELCGLGSTCGLCKNSATYWHQKAFTACGTEPKWTDGSLCGLGTTCNLCENPATYWVGKLFTACGEEPCWPDNTVCLAGKVYKDVNILLFQPPKGSTHIYHNSNIRCIYLYRNHRKFSDC